jgi:hypothetical protein
MNSGDHETTRDVSRRRFAKVVVVALGMAGFAGAGLSGALASHGSDDGVDFSPSGGSAASGGSGSGGWEDDWVFSGSSGGSGGSGGSGWDDDWDDD